jgi:hypothetical protein
MGIHGASSGKCFRGDHAREWVIGGRRGVVRNCCVDVVVRVLDRVGAGLARGWIKRAFGG